MTTPATPLSATGRRALALATGLAVAVGGYFTLSSTTRTTAGITFSNRLTTLKDGRVIRSTVVPKARWRGGQTWIITIQHTDTTLPSWPVESLVVRAPSMQNWVYADTVWAPFPVCVPYRVTVVPDTVLTLAGNVSTRRDSLTAKTTLCRSYSVTELAYQDSFPNEGRRITICGGWMRKASLATLDSLLADRLAASKTAADSVKARAEIGAARTGADSLPVPKQSWVKTDTAGPIHVGYGVQLGVLAANRYTGRVVVESNPEDCQAEAASYAAWLKAGGTP